METEDENDKPLHPSFFNGRVLIDILTWEWGLYLGVSRVGPRKHRLWGAFDHVRTIDVKGRIQAPQEHRGRDIQIIFTPFNRKMRFSRRGPHSLGSLALFRSAPRPRAYEASLMLPEADLPMLAIALSTTTRYLDIWTPGLDVDVARITNYCLSATIGDKVKPWAGID